MAIISTTKKEVKEELLAGKPISITKFKDNESLLYDVPTKQWKAKAVLSSVPDGTYTVGIGTSTNGTITILNGIITAIQQAT